MTNRENLISIINAAEQLLELEEDDSEAVKEYAETINEIKFSIWDIAETLGVEDSQFDES